jgi:hypothetical protein
MGIDCRRRGRGRKHSRRKGLSADFADSHRLETAKKQALVVFLLGLHPFCFFASEICVNLRNLWMSVFFFSFFCFCCFSIGNGQLAMGNWQFAVLALDSPRPDTAFTEDKP